MQKKTKVTINMLNDKNYYKLNTYVDKTNFKYVDIVSRVFSTRVDIKNMTRLPHSMVGYVSMNAMDFNRFTKLSEQKGDMVSVTVVY